MTTGSPTLERPFEEKAPPAPEVLFEEARRRRRRRWLRGAGVLLLAGVGTGVGTWIVSGSAPRSTPRARSTTSTAVWTAAAPLCLPSTLTPRVVTHGTSAGTRMLTVTLVSHAARTCRLEGRPSVTVLGRGDVPLPTSEGSARQTVAGPARTVRVAPGGRVSFYVMMAGSLVTDAARGSCPALDGLRFTLPPSSGPSATEEAPMKPTGTWIIAAYPDKPGGPCDAIGVSVLFPTPPPPPSPASTGGQLVP